ncbi:MAG: D-alanine--D-alanine ligase [Pseudomonadales bacterium]|nr:D-alanine--D-alanine ligase [Pseudomonadales bacterium]MCP5183580.1 D-alanine--D-alanine ligase [Pseudomonadales bacterium]
MKRYRILVLTHETLVPPEDIEGLSEAEYDECRSEYNVYSTLYNLGHHVKVLGVGDSLSELRGIVREWRPHVVFNLLEDFAGIVNYDHYVVAYLEMLRQPYTGCNPRGLMLSRDKVLTKQILAWHRVATPAFQLFPLGRKFVEPKHLTFPLFVKSATDDASLGISQASIVNDMQSLKERVAFIHDQVGSDALVEEYIDGRELYVGVLGNNRALTLPAWEMNFGTLADVQAGIATRRVKLDESYQKKHGITTGRADLPEDMHNHLARVSKRIYRALHMSGFARMDYRMRPDGRLYLLEANANPNISFGEDFAESAQAAGLDYDALIMRIVRLGMSYTPEWRMAEK